MYLNPGPKFLGGSGSGSGSGSFHHQVKKGRKALIFTVLCLLYDFLALRLACSKPLTKRAESGAGAVNQWFGSADLVPNCHGFTTLIVIVLDFVLNLSRIGIFLKLRVIANWRFLCYDSFPLSYCIRYTIYFCKSFSLRFSGLLQRSASQTITVVKLFTF
jgi:hypothetical protein